MGYTNRDVNKDVTRTSGKRRHYLSRLIAIVIPLCLTLCLSSGLSASAYAQPVSTHLAASDLRDVVLVGNSVSGTVSFLDGHTFSNLGSFNVIPDLQQRLAAIEADPIAWAGYEAVRSTEGGDRFVDLRPPFLGRQARKEQLPHLVELS